MWKEYLSGNGGKYGYAVGLIGPGAEGSGRPGGCADTGTSSTTAPPRAGLNAVA